MIIIIGSLSALVLIRIYLSVYRPPDQVCDEVAERWSTNRPATRPRRVSSIYIQSNRTRASMARPAASHLQHLQHLHTHALTREPCSATDAALSPFRVRLSLWPAARRISGRCLRTLCTHFGVHNNADDGDARVMGAAACVRVHSDMAGGRQKDQVCA